MTNVIQIPVKPIEICPVCKKPIEWEKREDIDRWSDVARKWPLVPMTPHLFYARVEHKECASELQRLEQERRNREKAEALDREKREWVQKTYGLPGLPRNASTKTLEVFQISEGNRQAAHMVKVWTPADDFGFFLMGPAGSGKTHLMLAILNRIVDEDTEVFLRYRSVLWMPVSMMLDQIRAEMADNSDSLKRSILSCKYLFLDDIGVENSTDWVREQMFQILDHRLNMRLRTFISTNLKLEELKTRMHERILSRIKELAVILQIDCRDRRNDIMKSRMEVLKRRMPYADA